MKHETLTDCLEHWSQEKGADVWLRELHEDGTQDYTWSESKAQVDAVATALERRFGSGANMLLLSRNRPHWVLADLAVIRSGNAAVALFTTHTAATAKYIAEFTDAPVLILGESPNWPALREILPPELTIITLPGVEFDGEHLTWEQLVTEGKGDKPSYVTDASDTISLVFTSGTTGLPKGVIQTHDSNLIPIRRAYDFIRVAAQPRYFSYLPLSHLAERQIVEFASLFSGGEILFNERPDTLLRDLQQAKPHIFFGAPRVWEQFQQAVYSKFGGQESFEKAFKADPAAIGKR
ncbi:MAG: AMP-binding protein, partial [Cyanobacteria bacterium P01_G01_bin.4]